jgi:DNA-binding IscR family transcriptional regulator
MRADFRLSRMLHVLIHIHGREKAASSEDLAVMLDTNPVLVRRMMAGLREAGYVSSTGGRNGGWTLVADPAEITVLDVYQALEEPVLFAIGTTVDHPGCRIEGAITGALDLALASAAGKLLRQFGDMKLSDFLPAGQPQDIR